MESSKQKIDILYETTILSKRNEVIVQSERMEWM